MMSAEIGPETNIYPQLATQLVSAITHLHNDVTRAKSSGGPGSCSQIRGML